jgi:lysine/ornithine N-monooxygenase
MPTADPTTADDSRARATMTVPGGGQSKLINGVAVCDDDGCIVCGGIDVGDVSPPALPSVPSPATVMRHQLDDIETSVLIVGGGPHALAVLSALHERSLAFPQFTNQNVFNMRVGFDSLQKVGTVCVMDPGQNFLEEWHKRFEALGIAHLRSPAFAHPKAYEPQALVKFAESHGRTNELLNVPFVTQRHSTEGITAQEPLLYGLPTTALFRDFCSSLEAELPHQWLSARAVQVLKDESTGKFRARYTSGDGDGWVIADAVVLATGPAGERNVPEPFRPFADSGYVTHTAEFLSNGKAIASMSPRSWHGSGSGDARLLVIGGGLTAAQAALAAVAAGSRVVLRSRRPLTTRAYDLVSEDWLNQRHATRLRSEFFTTPVEGRLKMVREAVQGGSVPESYMKELRRLASTSDRLELQTCEGIHRSVVFIREGKVHVDDEVFDHIILATGSSSVPGLTPLYKQVEVEFGLRTVDNYPLLDDGLSWMPNGEDLFVVGANAVLELGPGALNLMGAMRGGRIVAEGLRDLMWSTTHSKAASAAVTANQFSLLDCSDDSDDSDVDSDGSEDDIDDDGA